MPFEYDIRKDIRFQEGREEGRKEGREEGRKEGRKEIIVEYIKNALELGVLTTTQIAGLFKVSEDDVLEIAKETKGEKALDKDIEP